MTAVAWRSAYLFAFILLLNCCASAALVPTTLVTFHAVGSVQGERFESRSQVACVPHDRLYGLQPEIDYDAFPQWQIVGLNGRILALSAGAICYRAHDTQADILVQGFLAEGSAAPRWVAGIRPAEFVVSLDRESVRTASARDKQVIKDGALNLLRTSDLFCLGCHWTNRPAPFVRVIRRDIDPHALPQRFFETFGDGNIGACRRSREIPTPSDASRLGVEMIDLARCTRFRQVDPGDWKLQEVEPMDCGQFHPHMALVAPSTTVSDTDTRLWRTSLYSDPLSVDSCQMPRYETTRDDVRLYQSDRSTFMLYQSGMGYEFPLRLYDGGQDDLRHFGFDAINDNH